MDIFFGRKDAFLDPKSKKTRNLHQPKPTAAKYVMFYEKD